MGRQGEVGEGSPRSRPARGTPPADALVSKSRGTGGISTAQPHPGLPAATAAEPNLCCRAVSVQSSPLFCIE